MLGYCKMIMEKDGVRLAINPMFDKLITSLRIVVDSDGVIDKEATSYNDIFDAFRLLLGFMVEIQKIITGITTYTAKKN